ncbi:MAG: retron St85 family RNA-directed DNA polymerase [Candidatus Sericytochromatia bacterium]
METSKIWQEIIQAGSIDKFINNRLLKNGFLVTRRDTDKMDAKQLKEYKDSLKKESEERKKLKKEAWKSYKENNITYIGDDIFWQDKVYEDKFDIKNPEIKISENELPQIDTPKQLADALGLTISELRWLTFNKEAAKSIHYHSFEIPKRSGETRLIWAPRPKIKAAQRWILQNILEQLPIHGNAHGFLPERSILTNARPHTNSKCLIKIDIKDFFPSITFPRVKGVFRNAGYKEQVATLLALLCTESPREVLKIKDKTYFVAISDRCLPQGAPTSPALSNIVSMNLDKRLRGLSKSNGWRYTRYADDLSFSFPDNKKSAEIGYMLGAIKRIVEEECFKVNIKKTWVSRKGGKQAVTGIIVNGKDKPRASRELKRKIRAIIHNLQKGKTLHDGESIHQIIGFSSYVAMIEPEIGKEFIEKLKPFLSST